jgi:hypothetical protein
VLVTDPPAVNGCPLIIVLLFHLYGDEGIRTPDLSLAKAALCQLSYIPDLQWAYLDSNQGPQLYQSCALAN